MGACESRERILTSGRMNEADWVWFCGYYSYGDSKGQRNLVW